MRTRTVIGEKRTHKMRALERRLGLPVERALVEAINRTGSLKGAAAELELPYDTLLRWLDKLRIEYRVVGTARLDDADAAAGADATPRRR